MAEVMKITMTSTPSYILKFGPVESHMSICVGCCWNAGVSGHMKQVTWCAEYRGTVVRVIKKADIQTARSNLALRLPPWKTMCCIGLHIAEYRSNEINVVNPTDA